MMSKYKILVAGNFEPFSYSRYSADHPVVLNKAESPQVQVEANEQHPASHLRYNRHSQVIF